MMANPVDSLVRAFVVVVAVYGTLYADVAWAQGAATEASPAAAQTDLDTRLEQFMANGPGAYRIKEKDGVITHILLVGKATLRKSLGDSAEETATDRAEAFAKGKLAKFMEEEVTLFKQAGKENLVLVDGDGEGVTNESGKRVEKNQEVVTQQAKAVMRGIQPFRTQITDKEVVVALLWTAKSAAQAFGVADANNPPPPPPKPRPAQGTVKPRTVVNPDAAELLK